MQSKHPNQDHASAQINRALAAGETLLWAVRPRTLVAAGRAVSFLVFCLIAYIFGSKILSVAISSLINVTLADGIIGVSISILLYGLIIGVFASIFYMNLRTTLTGVTEFYGVTDQNVIIVWAWWPRGTYKIPLHSIEAVTLSNDTITLITDEAVKTSFSEQGGPASLNPFNARQKFRLARIEDPEWVAELIDFTRGAA